MIYCIFSMFDVNFLVVKLTSEAKLLFYHSLLTHFERLDSSTIVDVCFGFLPHVLPCNFLFVSWCFCSAPPLKTLLMFCFYSVM